jgi:hypothetical protein
VAAASNRIFFMGLLPSAQTTQTAMFPNWTLNMSAFGGKADISDRLADIRH